MRPRRIPSLLSAIAVGSVAAVGFAAQEAEEEWQPLGTYQEEISVELVNVEVWVTDRQGRPVTGLTREDFELLEDGERVKITNFSVSEETVLADEGAEPPAAAEGAEPAEGEAPPAQALAEEPAPAAPAIDPERRLHMAVVIDNWNLQPNGRELVFDDLRQFLRQQIGPETLVMVTVHNRALQVIQDFTSDPARVERALERAASAAPGRIQLRNERRTAIQSIRDAWETAASSSLTGAGDICDRAIGQMENAGRSYATAVQAHVQRSAGALASVSEYLSGVPGRKVLVYVGAGLAQQPGIDIFQHIGGVCPHYQSRLATYERSYDLTALFQEVARRANAAGIALYTIEAAVQEANEDIVVAGLRGRMSDAGATTEATGDASSGSEGGGGVDTGAGLGGSGARQPTPSYGQSFQPSISSRRTADFTEEDSLVFLAQETGGRAILNASSFEDEFDRLATELRTYYSLGFTPAHQGDGRLHRLEVKLREKGYRVRHRQAYLDKPHEVRMAERLRGAAQFGTGSNPLALRVETGEATVTPSGAARVPLRIWVPLDRLALTPEDGKRRGSLRVMLAVTDAAGNLGPVRQKVVPVQVGSGASGAQTRDHLVEIELDLEGPAHVVALAVRDQVGGEASYVRHEVRLGPPPQARFDP